MSCVTGLLAEAAKGVEAQLKPQLIGFFGGIVRAYLPQRWVFVTEEGSATVGVETTGDIWVRDGAEASPDVTVRASHARLKKALTGRPGTVPSADQIQVTPHTARGRTAFDFARRRFGL